MINTLLGMAIDIETKADTGKQYRRPFRLVKPVAVRMTYEVYKAVKIPVIGMGGIFSGDDAIEFMLAGASAVMVGTACLVSPDACIRVCEGIERYMRRHGFKSVSDITGKLVLNT